MRKLSLVLEYGREHVQRDPGHRRAGRTGPPQAAKAHERGAELGHTVSDSAAGGAPNDPLATACVALSKLGYEPGLDEAGDVRPGNCPFHDLAATHRDATCGMNLAMVQGVLDGLSVRGLTARLDPEPGWCCVRITETPPADSAG